MTQKTLQVDHPGTHGPSTVQVAEALKIELGKDDLVPDGEFKIIQSKITSGGPSTLTVDVATKKSARGEGQA